MTAAAPVTYSPPAGTYGTPQTVTLSTETAGADIYYTVDGSDPRTESYQTGEVIDPTDGATYPVVWIAGAWWMQRNLAWSGAGVDYAGNPANRSIYGRLYTWAEAMAWVPSGWKIPTATQHIALINACGGPSVAGKRLKAISALWSPNTGTDQYGFSGLPGGYRRYDTLAYTLIGLSCLIWSSTVYNSGIPGTAYYLGIDSNADSVLLPENADSLGSRTNWMSIRAIVPDSAVFNRRLSTIYTAPLTISETTTVKAIAVKAGLDDSAVTSAGYIIELSFLGAPISGLERGYSVSIDRHVAVREAIGGGVRLIPRAPAQSDVWTVDAEVMLTAAQAGPFEAAVGAYGSDTTGILNLPARGGASTFCGLAPAVAGTDADTYIITAMRNPDAMGRRAVAVDLFAYRVQFDLIGSANAPIALTSTVPDWLPKKFATHALRDSSQWNVYASPSTGFPIHPAAKVKHGRGQGYTITLDALDDSQADHLMAWFRNSRSAPVTITIDRGIAGQGAVSVYLVDLSLARDVGLYWSGSLEVVEA